mgnify:CR=1 FL=1
MKFCDIEADRIKFRLFVLSGCVAAVASMFMLMRFASAESEFANGYDTDSPERLISHVFFSISRLRLQ